MPEILPSLIRGQTHGALVDWAQILEALPENRGKSIRLDQASVTVEGVLSVSEAEALRGHLMALHPWRKGPYSLFGIEIDTEWRSDLKWDRLQSAIAPLEGRQVLDVGCGSGYHLWRMIGLGARSAIGIDPTWLSVVQFLAVRRLVGPLPVIVLPMGIDEVPRASCFDTVFSMGVLYHRRSPLDHLLDLLARLRPGGELVLETLVIEGPEGQVLVPEDRYAQMRNVWFIPSPGTLHRWLARAGFRKIRMIDLSVTTVEEQRKTPWMRFHSLADFLDPRDERRTLEGYPRPRRAIFLAEAPQLS